MSGAIGTVDRARVAAYEARSHEELVAVRDLTNEIGESAEGRDNEAAERLLDAVSGDLATVPDSSSPPTAEAPEEHSDEAAQAPKPLGRVRSTPVAGEAIDRAEGISLGFAVVFFVIAVAALLFVVAVGR